MLRSQLRCKDNARALGTKAVHEERAGHPEHAERPAPGATAGQLRARTHACSRARARRRRGARTVSARLHTLLWGRAKDKG